jgi:hypothetical protein
MYVCMYICMYVGIYMYVCRYIYTFQCFKDSSETILRYTHKAGTHLENLKVFGIIDVNFNIGKRQRKVYGTVLRKLPAI